MVPETLKMKYISKKTLFNYKNIIYSEISFSFFTTGIFENILMCRNLEIRSK